MSLSRRDNRLSLYNTSHQIRAELAGRRVLHQVQWLLQASGGLRGRLWDFGVTVRR